MAFADDSDIEKAPWESKDPRGYKKFICDQEITLAQALGKVGMSMEQVGLFNFGDDLTGYGVSNYEECFDKFYPYLCWWRNDADVLTGDKDTEDDPAWFWVPGDCTLNPDPDPHGAHFSGYKNPHQEEKAKQEADDRKEFKFVPPMTTGREYYAARSEAKGVWATCTVDTGIKPGDILLSHHQCDDFISKLTLSWPTHAGIALNEMWAVDADNRGDDNAVDYITMMHFFAQKERTNDPVMPGVRVWPHDYHLTPHGGLVYRYVGKPGDSPQEVERVCNEAAKWAKEQTGNQYTFSLKSSQIVGKKGGLFKKAKIKEKEFDSEGKAVDEKGQRATRYSRSKKKREETEKHSIYCAELVWRAYRKAGVNIVDPKKLANLFADSSHGVAAVLSWNLRNEAWSFDEVDDKADNLKQEIDADAKDLKDKKKSEKIKGLGPLIQKSFKLECLRNARAVSLVPGWLARKIMIAIVNKKFNANFCAPYQLAQSKLTERVAQLPPILEVDDKGNPKYDFVKVTDFRKKNIHPYKVLEAVSGDEKAWEDFEKKEGTKLELDVEKPWHNSSGEPEAPELRMDSDEEDQFYNAEVKFKGPQEKPPFVKKTP